MSNPLLMEPTVAVIDHLDGIHLENIAVEESQDELAALQRLRHGLDFLDRRVREIERGMLEHWFSPGNVVPSPWAVSSTLWVASAFHWYSTSAYQYTQTVGWLATNDRRQAKAYAARVLPNLVVWRHKIGAHFARTDPRNEDSLADQMLSVQFPVTFHGTEFWTAMRPVAVKDAGRWKVSRNDMAWSLTRVHREMCARYWPIGVHEDSESTHT
ncbi:MAG: hypothetical protein ABIU97_06410 [Dehalococcoidia bacterium]